jgi:hypothetical protein
MTTWPLPVPLAILTCSQAICFPFGIGLHAGDSARELGLPLRTGAFLRRDFFSEWYAFGLDKQMAEI